MQSFKRGLPLPSLSSSSPSSLLSSSLPLPSPQPIRTSNKKPFFCNYPSHHFQASGLKFFFFFGSKFANFVFILQKKLFLERKTIFQMQIKILLWDSTSFSAHGWVAETSYLCFEWIVGWVWIQHGRRVVVKKRLPVECRPTKLEVVGLNPADLYEWRLFLVNTGCFTVILWFQ